MEKQQPEQNRNMRPQPPLPLFSPHAKLHLLLNNHCLQIVLCGCPHAHVGWQPHLLIGLVMFGLCYHVWVIYCFQEGGFIDVNIGTAHDAALIVLVPSTTQRTDGLQDRSTSQRKSTTRLGLKKRVVEHSSIFDRVSAAKTMVPGHFIR